MRLPGQHFIQRKCAHCEEEEKKINRKPLPSFIQRKTVSGSGVASSAVSATIAATKGGGSPLSGDAKTFMENRFGTDFSNVKIHTGSNAAQLSGQLNAQAFTVGNDIYFNEGKFAPGSNQGKHLLAHELTHTLQQGEKHTIQRSCSDGKCDSCNGGKKDFWVTYYFRTKASEKVLKYVEDQTKTAAKILANCCLNLKTKSDTSLIAGGGKFDWQDSSKPGEWHYNKSTSDLGTGNTFKDAKGIPIIIADEVPDSGGGITVDKRFDKKYSGKTYAAIAVNETNSSCNSLAHELWHVSSGIVGHDKVHGGIAECSSDTVSDEYCKNMRLIAGA